MAAAEFSACAEPVPRLPSTHRFNCLSNYVGKGVGLGCPPPGTTPCVQPGRDPEVITQCQSLFPPCRECTLYASKRTRCECPPFAPEKTKPLRLQPSLLTSLPPLICFAFLSLPKEDSPWSVPGHLWRTVSWLWPPLVEGGPRDAIFCNPWRKIHEKDLTSPSLPFLRQCVTVFTITHFPGEANFLPFLDPSRINPSQFFFISSVSRSDRLTTAPSPRRLKSIS